MEDIDIYGMQRIQVVNQTKEEGNEICCQSGHDWETVSVIDHELVDGTKYEVLLVECLECGEEKTALGDEVEEEGEVS